MLVQKLQANSGHLRVALHTLESLHWINRNEKDECTLTAEAKMHRKIPGDMMAVLDFPMADYVQQARYRMTQVEFSSLLGIWQGRLSEIEKNICSLPNKFAHST